MIIGVEGSGKTTFVKQLKIASKKQQGTVVVSSSPTMGMDVSVEEFAGVKSFVYDLGGHEHFEQAYWKPLVGKADAIIYIINAAKVQSTLKRVKEHLKFIMETINQKEVPIIILSNKQDLKEAKSVDEVNEAIEFERLERDNPDLVMKNFPISAKTGENIGLAFDWLIDVLLTLYEVSMTRIYEVYIYHRESGLPYSYIFPLDESNRNIQETRATLVSGFNAALGSFSDELFQESISNILMIKDPTNPENSLKILNCKSDTTPLNCIIIADASATDDDLGHLARGILEQFIKENDWQGMASIGIITPVNIRSITSRALHDEKLSQTMVISSKELPSFHSHEIINQNEDVDATESSESVLDENDLMDAVKSDESPRQDMPLENNAMPMKMSGDTNDSTIDSTVKIPDVIELEEMFRQQEQPSDARVLISANPDNSLPSSRFRQESSDDLARTEIKTHPTSDADGSSLNGATKDELSMDLAGDEYYEAFQRLSILERIKEIERRRKRRRR